MEPTDLLQFAASVLDSLGIAYFTTGSMASVRYGEPRYTNDVDIVIIIDTTLVDALCASFPEEDFYVSDQAAREAIAHCSQFNVIQPATGLKIDFMVADQSEFNRNRFERVQTLTMETGNIVRFASPEDVIIRKLEYYKEGGSDKHLRDIRGILNLCQTPIDHNYIQHWADRLGVLEQWQSVTVK